MEKIKANRPKLTKAPVDPRIEAIKEIIFGESIQDFEERFKKLTAILEASREKIENRVDEIEERLLHDMEKLQGTGYGVIEKLETTHTEKISNIESDMIKKSDLADLFLQIGQKLKGND